MRTLGIDLAARPTTTAVCEVEWQGASATMTRLAAGADGAMPLDDAYLISCARTADKVAIDAPFGWPDGFVAAISAHAKLERWPGHAAVDPDEYRAWLTYRETDRFVMDLAGRPLSVSTDKLGITAMRCAHLLDLLAQEGVAIDRTGEQGAVVEAYPAGALYLWGLEHRGYKRSRGAERRAANLRGLTESLPELEISPARRVLCRESDDALDALVCALLARAAAIGRTHRAPPEGRERARREGWIHLPKDASPARLIGA